jgi:antitoxin component of MazEF toxin-antitoxin module
MVKNNLFDKISKTKHLQKLANSHCLVIPKSWIDCFEWTGETELIMEVSPADRRIIIREKPKEIEEKVEEIL